MDLHRLLERQMHTTSENESCYSFLSLSSQSPGAVLYFRISVILGILEIFAVSQGIVGIRGVFSNSFLAMSKKGKLHATVSNNILYVNISFIMSQICLFNYTVEYFLCFKHYFQKVNQHPSFYQHKKLKYAKNYVEYLLDFVQHFICFCVCLFFLII